MLGGRPILGAFDGGILRQRLLLRLLIHPFHIGRFGFLRFGALESASLWTSWSVSALNTVTWLVSNRPSAWCCGMPQ